MTQSRFPLTQILNDAAAGDPAAGERLLSAVYDQLRHLAAGQMARESPGGQLQATALVHEAYLRLLGNESSQQWDNRAHFFGAAAEAMRRILVEHARARLRIKRGGGWHRVDLDHAEAAGAADDADPGDVLALDEALARLQQFDPRLAEIVKLRCFVGLTIAEAAAALGVSSRTIDRDWTTARAWLKAELSEKGP
jgi:RNA polymerase sigma factor (TIGR02999 family)